MENGNNQQIQKEKDFDEYQGTFGREMEMTDLVFGDQGDIREDTEKFF